MKGTYSRGEFLALLVAMTSDPDHPDRRSTEQIEHDDALESIAEDRDYMRRHPTDLDSEWAARRWAS